MTASSGHEPPRRVRAPLRRRLPRRGRAGHAVPLALLAVSLGACGSASGTERADGRGETRSDAAAETTEPPACSEDVPPGASCRPPARDPEHARTELAGAIAARFVAEHAPEELEWGWSEGVLAYGLMATHEVTGEAALRDWVAGWLAHHREAGYEVAWSDDCPPALAAMQLWQRTGEEVHRDVVDDVLHYILQEAPRTEAGGISHMGLRFPDTRTLWTDSLFMVGVPLARWGELGEAPEALEEASRQVGIFADELQQPNGLFRHAVGWPSEQDDDVFWGRGNGWALAATHEILRVRRLRGEADPEVAEPARRLTEAAIELQDDASGLWWTVMNRPGETYLETSAAALFAYGLARGLRFGHRGEPARAALADALEGVRSRIARDEQDRPVVTGISGPTSVGDFERYASVERKRDVPFGVGAVLLALTEASALSLPER